MEALKKIRLTFELVRFSHTIFALPFALASMLVAASGLPDIRTVVLILLCMILARSSAMAFNRYVDADIDGKNPRTQNRHIPSGLLTKPFVMSFCLMTGLGFIATTYFLNQLAFALAPLALLITWLYSLTKRWTHYAQLALGLALAISPVGAWIAVTGTLDGAPFLLAAAVAFWVAGFDIFYSTQDHDFDQQAGLKSLVVRFGIPRALKLARLFHILTVIFLMGFGYFVPNAAPYLIGCALVTAVLIYEHSLVRPDDLSQVNQAFFTLNGWIGVVYLTGVAASVFLP